MFPRTLIIALLLVIALAGPSVATSSARSMSWSGYTWDVRPTGFGAPGPNAWSDAEANAHVDGSDLILSVVKDAFGRWTSAEVDNQQHLGYGTYRWVVASDLSALDAHAVLGMFTYGGASPSNNEIDLEASHWGDLSAPGGSGTVWQDAQAKRNTSKSFAYSDRPPYVHQFTWAPGRISYLVTDAAGAALFDWTVTSGVPTPSTEVPIVNYWRSDGVPPAAARSMRISSFTWVPLGQKSARARAQPARVRLGMRPRRFAATGRRRGATVTWSATTATRLRLVVQRSVRGRSVAVGSLKSSPRKGKLRFDGKVNGRRLRPGRYRLAATVSAAAGGERRAARSLRFTVLAK